MPHRTTVFLSIVAVLAVAAADVPAYIPNVTLHPTVYLDLCRSDIILRNASEALGSCKSALTFWSAHAEAVFDARVRRATRDNIETLTPERVFVGRPETHICKSDRVKDYVVEGLAHTKLHPSPLPWFRADAWFDGRDVYLSGVLASHYTQDKKDAFLYILAHERAHATETTEEACDAVAESTVRLSEKSRHWLHLIRSQ